MSGYFGSPASQSTFSGFKPYLKKDISEKAKMVQVKGMWCWLEEITDPESIELLGKWNVCALGYGAIYIDWDSLMLEEKQLLKTTL